MNTILNVSLSNNSYSNTTNNTRRFFPPSLPCPSSTTDDIVWTVLFSILIFLILMGNSLVIASFKVNRRLRTKTNYFILSLAFADLAIGSISVPSWMYITLCPGIRNPMAPEYLLVKIWTVLDITVGVSSILNLTMISLERGYALMRPIHHRNIKKRFIVIAIITAWSLAVFAGCLRLMHLPTKAAKAYGIIVTVPFFIVPLSIILATYAVIFRIASAHARGRGVRSFKKDLRIATTVAVVIGFFSIAWLPFFSLNFLFSICSRFGVLVCTKVPMNITPYIKCMQYGNSACNPIIYGFRNKDFKLAFKKILFKICGKEVALTQYTRTTFVKTARSRFVRSESSFDESHSVLYPDQIVPPGMYDMRESYRSAMIRGHKSPKKRKTPKKDLAHGLMVMNAVEAFSMPVDSVEIKPANSNLKSQKTVVILDQNTADHKTSPLKNGTQTSLDIDIYPYEGKALAHDKGLINEAFRKSQDDITGTKEKSRPHVSFAGVINEKFVKIQDDITGTKETSRPHVSFAATNGLANGRLVQDEKKEQELHLELSVALEQKERSYSDITPILYKGEDNPLSDRRSSLT